MKACFLCNPNSNLIYEKSDQYYAMFGYGPIVEGYTLISTKNHIKSMLDISEDSVQSLIQFTNNVKKKLSSIYGSEIIITEHGRIRTCEILNDSIHESHCYHAHRLVFPIHVNMKQIFLSHNFRIKEYSNFKEAYKLYKQEGEYLYFEDIDGSCIITQAPKSIANQFFRRIVAEKIGSSELTSWKEYPRLDFVLQSVEKMNKQFYNN